MLYVIAGLRERSTWGLGARLYLRSLALSGLPFRLLMGTPGTSIEVPEGGVAYSYRGMFDPSEVPACLQPIVPHHGPDFSGGIKAPTAMLCVGEVWDCAQRISQPDECPQKNLALTSWPADRLPSHLAGILNRYDLVIVPEGQKKTFKDAGVYAVEECPWPSMPLQGTPLVVPKSVTKTLALVGTWSLEDCVGRVATVFLEKWKKSDGVGMILSCPDIPPSWIETMKATATDSGLPFLAVYTPSGLFDDPGALDPVLAACDGYLDASRRMDGGFWARRAVSLGIPVQSVFADAPCTYYEGGEMWPAVTVMEQYRGFMGSDEDIERTIEDVIEEPRRPAGTPTDEAAGVLKRLIENALSERRVFAPAPAEDGIGIVVPYQGTDTTVLQQCLRVAREALRGQDKLVVSTRGNATGAKALCAELGIAAIHSGPHDAGTPWNLSAARNAGIKYLSEHEKVQYVTFVDADVLVPVDWTRRLAREAYKRPGLVLTPHVVDEGGDALKTTRIASGMSLYPIRVLVAADGFDEAYVGWGHEDIDLIERLKLIYGIAAIAMPSVVATHLPHEPQASREEDHKRNTGRLDMLKAKLAAGEQATVNPDGWGEYEVLS